MIRPATPADREAICALHLASWQDSYGAELSAEYLATRLPKEMARKWAGRTFEPPELVVVLDRDDGIAGFACALSKGAIPLIDNLHVRPELRSQGAGARLLHVVLDALWVEGHDRAYLTVLESNTRALAFYLAHGGIDMGPVDDFLVDEPVRARRIEFALGTGSNLR